MKKLLLGAAMMISFLSFSLAQTPATEKAAKQPSRKTTAAQTSTTTQSKTEAKSAEPAKTVKLKKDGTPDKRYTAGRTASKAEPAAAVKLKKDGTPDKRYKANKKT